MTQDVINAVGRETVSAPSLGTRILTHHLLWPAVAFVVLIVACGVFSPGFLDITIRDGHLFGQLIDILRASATPLLLALGMCLVIASGGIDLSVGAVMAMSLAISLTFLKGSASANSVPTALVAIGLGLLIGLAVGLFNGTMVSVLKIQPFIATMIIMVAGRGIAMLMTKGQITTVYAAPFKAIGSGFFLGLPIPVVIAAVVTVLVLVVVRKTALGTLLESIGINRQAAHLAGVPAGAIILLVYGLCGLLAGLAGMVYGAPTMAADANNIGLMKELDAILCVVIGGTSLAGGKFYLSGTVIGALVLSTLERAVIIFRFPSQTTPLFKAVVVIVICVAQSRTLRERIARRSLRVQAAKGEVTR
ncbi:MAG: ABC transporter permease [Propionibacteriaceae bacterium]|jgi:simple sugar transport system permease protein|nr:ABC transporter permease [Propionibacteriaceae bacterium]